MALITPRKIGSFVAGGAAAQGAGAISGLLLARWMSVSDYAIYTVAVTMIGAIALLTKGGVRMGLAASLTTAWPDKARSAVAIASAIRSRLLISALILPPMLLFAWYLLSRAGAGTGLTAIVIAILALVWVADMRSSVIDQLLFFDGQAVRVQNADTGIAFGRTAMVLGLKLFNAVSVVAALLINLAALAARVPFVQTWVHRTLDHIRGEPEPETARAIRTVAVRQLPVDLFTVFQSQAQLFFLTQYSSNNLELATFGALARIAQILTPFGAVSLAFFVPAFALVTERVVRRILQYTAIGAMPGIGLLLVSIVAPQALLFFIGPQYMDQAYALMVCAGTVALTSAVQVAWSLVAHRGWNRWAWLRIPIGLVWTVVAMHTLPLHTAAGAYLLFAGFAIGTLVALVCDLASAQRAGEISLFGRLPG